MGKKIEVTAEFLKVRVVQEDNGDNTPYMVFKLENGKKASFAVTTIYYNKIKNEGKVTEGTKGKLVYSKGMLSFLVGCRYISFTPGA